MPPLIEALGSRNAEVRYHAAALLRQRDPAAQAAVPALLAVLAEPAPAKEPGGPTGPTFNAMLSDPGIAAARALGEIAPGTSRSAEVVKALGEVLASHTSWQRRYEAAGILRRSFGARESEPAIPVMLKVLGEARPSKEPLGQAVAAALGQLAPGTPWEGHAVTALTSALDAAWDYTRADAARALARFGPAPPRAPPAQGRRRSRPVPRRPQGRRRCRPGDRGGAGPDGIEREWAHHPIPASPRRRPSSVRLQTATVPSELPQVA